MSPHANHVKNPSYRQVCNGDTGHVEVLQVELNNPKAHFEELIKFFFLFHDPTTMNRQGNDRGSQYASAIFYEDEEQKLIIEKVIRELQSAVDSGKVSAYSGNKIVTGIHRATQFYVAQDDHQEVRCLSWPMSFIEQNTDSSKMSLQIIPQYLEKNPSGYW
jgi:peptide-methionine (S)-S-oxide reductase